MTCIPLTIDLLQDVIDFLSHDEQNHISLLYRLLEYGDNFTHRVWIFYHNEHICAVIMYTSSESIYHGFSPYFFKSAALSELEKIEMQHCFCTQFVSVLISLEEESDTVHIEGIVGEKNGTIFIQECIYTHIQTTARQITDYDFLQYDAALAIHLLKKEEMTLSAFTPSLHIDFANEKHIDDLYPLHREYHLEEVLPKGSTLNTFLCRADLLLALQKKRVCALWCFENPVAKASYNAQGLHWDQIGGVYTVPQWRNKGFARVLVRFLAQNSQDNGRNTALFVRKTNPAAFASYTKAGFVKTGEYRIVYY